MTESLVSQLAPELQRALNELGYHTLTPIQEQSLPPLLAGKDVIGQSRTGSGKTAAFALPILNALYVRLRAPQALVLCPTRELCAQVASEIRKLGRHLPGLQVLTLCGGQPFRPQALSLAHGAQVLVGTPGRVLDHVTRKTLPVARLRTLVLDEADRMLDMGFEEDMRAILSACPSPRQMALFSATFPPTIAALSGTYQKNPVRVTVAGESADTAEPAPPIRQIVHEVAFEQKAEALVWLLGEHQPESTVVFTNQRATAAELATKLSAAGFSSTALHGDLEQRDRDKVMALFRNRSIRVLVATDVAARGIDVDALDLVVNYDLPAKPEVYVHRIGRTGRAGKKGLAIALKTPREQHKIDAIEDYTSVTIEPRRLPAPEQLTAAVARPVAASPAQGAAMRTLRIGGGRKNKVRPGDILGALTGEAGGLAASSVGKIEIHDFFAYVAIQADLVATAQQSLANGRIKGRRFPVTLEA